MGKVPQEIIDQILDRTDIVEVISEYVQMKKAGRNFKACCPFHNEKTPSFIISPEKQIYHCFGCGEGGNALGFVMKIESLTFPEAIEMLAEKAKIPLPQFSKQTDEETSISSKIYEINTIAATFYQNALRSPAGKIALDYIKRRGIDTEALNSFRIGFAPAEWESLKKYLLGKGYTGDLLLKAGLTVASEKNKSEYDRFRNRLMFPVFNERGNVVAFGGRVLDDSLPKYINSPETPVYVKSNILYGLNFSKSSIREKGYVLIVEGYMDVVIPFQSGVKNIVATSGTALTSRHVNMLKRYTDTAVIVFDPDQAGKTASLRGLEVLIENDMNVRIATIPGGDDPDSFVKKHGTKGFDEVVEKAKDLFDYKLDILLETTNHGKEVKDRVSIINAMLPTIAKLNSAVTRAAYLKRLSDRMGINESAIREEMQKIKPDSSYVPQQTEEVKVVTPVTSVNSETHLLGLAMSDKKMYAYIIDELGIDIFKDANVSNVMKTLGDIYKTDGTVNAGKLVSRFEADNAAKSVIVKAIAKLEITDDKERVLKDCVSCVRKENKKHELKTLTVQLKKAEELQNHSKVTEILSRINELHKEKVM